MQHTAECNTFSLLPRIHTRYTAFSFTMIIIIYHLRDETSSIRCTVAGTTTEIKLKEKGAKQL
jgi:hypothetical protein